MQIAHRKTVRELRIFGLAFGTAMTLLGSLLLWKERPAAPYVLGFAAVLYLCGILRPQILRPLEMLMARILRAVTAVVTYAVLSLSFFLVVTPIGLILRWSGKDPLGLEKAPEQESFWVPVEEDGPAFRADKPY